MTVGRLVIAGAVLALSLFTGTIRAQAEIESCQARIATIATIGAANGAPAARFAYDLMALSPRIVDASLIADTDRGWFAWSVKNVELENVVRRLPSGLKYGIAASQPMLVEFPDAVTLRHAWVTSADATGCNAPAFQTGSMWNEKDLDGRPLPKPSPLPTPYARESVAAAVAPPFAVQTCALPFAAARVKTLATGPDPNFDNPDATGGVSVAMVVVGVDGSGTLLGEKLIASSGYAPFDLATLRAARMTTYIGGTSYCRPASDLYIYRRDFVP